MNIVMEQQKSNIQFINSKIQYLLHRFEVDRAVFFGLLSRILTFCAGPITAILIAAKFTPEIQGYHYTFLTILAFQAAVDLGFGTVVIQFVSHEWSKLNLNKNGQIVGDADALSRLVSIANISLRWYFVASFIVISGLGLGGYIFFSNSPNIGINWQIPWLILCILTGMSFCLIPVWSLLEGCNQVKKVYTFRFIQSAVVNLSIWGAILFGANLWTATVSSAASLFCSIIFFLSHYWSFLKSLLFGTPSGPRINWRAHMLPMQWRFAISVFTGLFMTSIFTPIMFKYHGPVMAGQMGMTWSLINILGLASSWLNPKTPQFGMLVAEKKYIELDRLFWKLTKIVFVLTLLLGLVIFILVLIINIFNVAFANRILPPLPTGLLLIAQCLIMSSMTFSMYMRAHKKEPIMLLNVFGAILTISLVWLFGKHYAAVGMALAYLLVMLIIIPLIFLIWYRCKNKWQSETLEPYHE